MADWALVVAMAAATSTVYSLTIIDRLTKRVANLERALDATFRYALEIDPRHDEERRLLDALHHGDGLFDGMNHMEYVREKRARGERTLLDPILQPDGQ